MKEKGGQNLKNKKQYINKRKKQKHPPPKKKKKKAKKKKRNHECRTKPLMCVLTKHHHKSL